MGKSKPKQKVVEYRMSLHYGMCIGVGRDDLEQIHITRIKINDKVAWQGNEDDSNIHEINERELFGGIKKEGGAVGRFVFFPGGSFQSIHENLANKVGRTEFTMPAYRGQASIWFYEHGSNNSGRKGFYWSANQPFIPSVEVLTSRASFDLFAVDPRLWRPADENLIAQSARPDKQAGGFNGPWFSTGSDVIIATGLPDPFGGNLAFSLQDANNTPSFADQVSQGISTAHLPSLQRIIVSTYIKRDAGQSVFSALGMFNNGASVLTYDHPTDAIDLDEHANHSVHDSGILTVPGQPDWRRIYMDLSLIIPPFSFWTLALAPAYGASGNFPGPQEHTPTGIIEFYCPMIQRLPPVT